MKDELGGSMWYIAKVSYWGPMGLISSGVMDVIANDADAAGNIIAGCLPEGGRIDAVLLHSTAEDFEAFMQASEAKELWGYDDQAVIVSGT